MLYLIAQEHLIWTLGSCYELSIVWYCTTVYGPWSILWCLQSSCRPFLLKVGSWFFRISVRGKCYLSCRIRIKVLLDASDDILPASALTCTKFREHGLHPPLNYSLKLNNFGECNENRDLVKGCVRTWTLLRAWIHSSPRRRGGGFLIYLAVAPWKVEESQTRPEKSSIYYLPRRSRGANHEA